MTCGLPGTGKSTWAEQRGLPVVEADDYRYVDGRYTFLKEREPWVWNQHDSKMRSYLGLGISFVLADCFLTRKIRAKYATEALRKGYRVCIMHLTAPEHVYSKQQTHGVGVTGYKRMRSEYQVPISALEPVSRVYHKHREA